jgi:hypothetical protein
MRRVILDPMRAGSILRILVRRGFPELLGRTFHIRFGNYDDWMWYDLSAEAFVIGVDNSLAGAPRCVLEGGLAHELAHIVRDLRLAPFQRGLAYERYRVNRAYRVRDEQDTDRELIRRGYARQLLALILWARKRGYTSGREHGLLLGEVYRIVRSNGG